MSLIRLGGTLVLALVVLCGSLAADERKIETRLKIDHDRGALDGLHAVLVRQRGEVIAEIYFDGEDELWGTSLGMITHGPETLHDLRSVTKSIVGLLYGIALEEGRVPGLDESLIAQFPEYPELAADPERRKITVRDALNMTMGLDWNENLPYSDPRNSEIAMELAADPVRFALDRLIVAAPGSQWTYSGGATMLIGALIERGTGQRLEVYAQDRLFGPPGLERVAWTNGMNGRASAASGLRMSARDLASLGQMLLDGGRANGQQVVPEAWLRESFTPAATTTSGLRYAHFWYQARDGDPPRWVAGFGNGGQRLMVHPGLGVVMVLFAGNYNEPDAWKLGVRVLTDYVIPEVTRE